MHSSSDRTRDFLAGIVKQRPAGEIVAELLPSFEELAPRTPGASDLSPEVLASRWTLLGDPAATREELLDASTLARAEHYRANIENFIGTVKVPVGIAGPLRVRGVHARGDYYVPLATTEATLVASCSRGAQAISRAGGATSAVVSEGVVRAPGFVFERLGDVGRFVIWITDQVASFRDVASTTTRHGRLIDMRVLVEGNHCFLLFEYETGDAAGQNMVTLATDAICRHIIAHAPVTPLRWYVEANLSGDKKASALALQSVRGRKVVAEVVLPAHVLESSLHCTARDMTQYYAISAVGGVMSGTMGLQGHYANPLAALYIACGQDAACVAESAVGITRFEEREGGALYAAVTLPNLIVGTVGGGTALPSQRACLDLLGLAGTGHARAFAEVCAAIVLAGELSIIAALSTGQFTDAHRQLARTRRDQAAPGPVSDPGSDEETQ